MFLPAWQGGPTALDFAVTNPLQAAVRQEAAASVLVVAVSYETAKLADRDTADSCATHGLRLVPMVVEIFGVWGPSAKQVFKTLARAIAERSGIPDRVATCQLYQAMGVRLQRANARAILSHTAASAASCSSRALATTSRTEGALLLCAVPAVGG
ncbi:unnamed protein product [Polarella glacialis]|uniref:Uncharacterized protein n=1 Tax=Polarella glacialis TaxID=89957 RepID=A0A813HBF7_POLGL|nr:unnamed protein product [Polarella glacialis]CAE8716739.1 unnamed protein product [Polarella glacialis]